jgi:hypothetical protein
MEYKNDTKRTEGKVPTSEFYGVLQEAYNIFNQKLFDGELPNCMITVQRKKSTYGYFSPERWVDDDGEKTHEIALNPAFFAGSSFIEVFQTLVHEMCHLWQHEYGNPSRGGYHNKEWAQKMEDIGLIPSNTGKEGGKKTGQKMADYPEHGGDFEKVCVELSKSGLFVKWVDRYPDKKAFSGNCETDINTAINGAEPGSTEAQEEGGNVTDPVSGGIETYGEGYDYEGIDEELAALYTPIVSEVADEVVVKDSGTKKNTKSKYMCGGCGIAVWGKPLLEIKCIGCDSFKLSGWSI